MFLTYKPGIYFMRCSVTITNVLLLNTQKLNFTGHKRFSPFLLFFSIYFMFIDCLKFFNHLLLLIGKSRYHGLVSTYLVRFLHCVIKSLFTLLYFSLIGCHISNGLCHLCRWHWNYIFCVSNDYSNLFSPLFGFPTLFTFTSNTHSITTFH